MYYHCTGYRGKCLEPYTREEKLAICFAARLRELVIPSEVIAWLQQEIVARDVREQEVRRQAQVRHQTEFARLSRHPDVLYDDRLEVRIDASTYDSRAAEIRENQKRVRMKMRELESMTPATAGQAVDLMVLTSKVADLFTEQSASEQSDAAPYLGAGELACGRVADVLPGAV